MELDALNGPIPITNLALIHTMLRDYDAAFDRIEQVLSVPAHNLSVGLLELDPRWDPLRELPRYQEILAKYR